MAAEGKVGEGIVAMERLGEGSEEGAEKRLEVDVTTWR